MAEAYKILASGSAAIGTTTLLTVVTAHAYIVKFMSVEPTASAPATFALQAGGRNITGPVPLGIDEWAQWEGSLALDAAKTLVLVTTGAAMDYVVSGVDLS
jgi:hypothetical protein